MADLFNRDATVIFGGANSIIIQMRDTGGNVVPSLRFSFKIVRSVVGCEGQADLTIYNMTKDHRVAFQEKGVPVVIKAGYAGSSSQIFQGKLFFAHSVLDGADWITKAQLVDGLIELMQARVNYSRVGPVTLEQLGQEVLSTLGIDIGNSSQNVNSVLRKLVQWSNGLTISGAADKVLDKISKAVGRRWFVQDGALNFLADNETLLGAGAEPLLAPGKGMIGSPQAGENGILKVRALLMPNLTPGHAVTVQSLQIQPARFRIEKTTFIGDTWGNDWYADLELRALKPGGA